MSFLFLAASLPYLLSKGQPNPVVLLNSNSCVPYLAEQQETSRFWSIESTQVSLLNFAVRYYDSCYNDDSMVDCNRLEHPRISWNETKESCPFPENACLTDTEAIGFDTGHLKLDLFGLNRPDAQDLTLRRRTTCAPINATLFQTEPQASLDGFRYYNFSASPLEHASILSGGPLDVKIGRNPYRNDYEVVTVTRMGDRRFNGPSVKAAFDRSDADMTAVIIDKEDVKYPSPVDDVVFGAHRLVHKLDARVRNHEGVEPAAMGPSKWYAADDPVSIIGCADQAEVCYTPDSVCTGLIPLPDELGWWFDAWKNAGLPFAHWPDGVGREIEDFVRGLVRRSGFKDIVSKRGSDILSIKKYGLGYELQSDIPPDQWGHAATRTSEQDLFFEQGPCLTSGKTRREWPDASNSRYAGQRFKGQARPVENLCLIHFPPPDLVRIQDCKQCRGYGRRRRHPRQPLRDPKDGPFSHDRLASSFKAAMVDNHVSVAARMVENGHISTSPTAERV
ncbi:MAG: hypothetical protein LQ345_006086 [Seirophora villosa]|nr:MAG: hypothetical protein LQ345_006086 [Seirophora villosa]